MASPRPRGSFGVDAPWVPWLWVGLGALYIVFTVLAATVWRAPLWTTLLVAVIALVFFAGGALYWHATFRGKFLVWRRVLRHVRTPTRVLDIGCGRGAVSIMTAQSFPGARIEGIDLWRSEDQSGNTPEAAEANARENGVERQVTFATADMTALPFPDRRFDLVTASLSIHNVHPAEPRATAVDEAWRVLAPGGQLVIVDISRVDEYRTRLESLGATSIDVSPAGWRMWWSGPWMATRILTAQKPS
jgi:arsenite methyltransferase